MNELNVSWLIVAEFGTLKGMLTMRDLIHFLDLRRDYSGLNEDLSAPQPPSQHGTDGDRGHGADRQIVRE